MEYLDIRYEILTKLHPYYLQPYCETSKDKLQECENLKYHYLQSWIWSDKSVLEIRNILPVVSWRDVVELCLFYHPIPESINEFDEFSLFLSACRTRQSHPLIYIRDHLLIDVAAVGWICYRYNRLDIIDELITKYSVLVNRNIQGYFGNSVLNRLNQLQTFHNMILVRNNPKAQIMNVKLTGHVYNFILSGVFLLPRTELLEVIVILSGLANDDKIFNYLTGRDKTFSSVSTEYDSIIINLIATSDKQTIDSLLYKYYPDVQVYEPRFQSPLQTGFWNTTDNNLDYRLHPELVAEWEPEKQLIFFLTSGNYAEYIRLRNAGVAMVIDADIILGVNDVGYVSMNREFQNRFNMYIDTEPDLAHLRVDITDPETYLFLDPLDNPYIFP